MSADVIRQPDDRSPDTREILESLDARLRWLSAWSIHNANHLRESRGGLKAGGHQASCASISNLMTALHFSARGPHDRVAVTRRGQELWRTDANE